VVAEGAGDGDVRSGLSGHAAGWDRSVGARSTKPAVASIPRVEKSAGRGSFEKQPTCTKETYTR